uniref:Uncharacterized protein n=1 Tax=Sphaerodactylus townsendi TaxID=933632 RepID=A0ACB8ELH4_9SAUR
MGVATGSRLRRDILFRSFCISPTSPHPRSGRGNALLAARSSTEVFAIGPVARYRYWLQHGDFVSFATSPCLCYRGCNAFKILLVNGMWGGNSEAAQANAAAISGRPRWSAGPKAKTLKRDFKALIHQHNSTSGNGPRTMAFYEEPRADVGGDQDDQPPHQLRGNRVAALSALPAHLLQLLAQLQISVEMRAEVTYPTLAEDTDLESCVGASTALLPSQVEELMMVGETSELCCTQVACQESQPMHKRVRKPKARMDL